MFHANLLTNCVQAGNFCEGMRIFRFPWCGLPRLFFALRCTCGGLKTRPALQCLFHLVLLSRLSSFFTALGCLRPLPMQRQAVQVALAVQQMIDARGCLFVVATTVAGSSWWPLLALARFVGTCRSDERLRGSPCPRLLPEQTAWLACSHEKIVVPLVPSTALSESACLSIVSAALSFLCATSWCGYSNVVAGQHAGGGQSHLCLKGTGRECRM